MPTDGIQKPLFAKPIVWLSSERNSPQKVSYKLFVVFLKRPRRDAKNETLLSLCGRFKKHCRFEIQPQPLILGLIKVDWTLLDVINDQIAKEENAFEDQLDSTQQAGYTLESFTAK